ncbi:hypothetical protein WAI453_006056 [Rhynchosporium graminicola]
MHVNRSLIKISPSLSHGVEYCCFGLAGLWICPASISIYTPLWDKDPEKAASREPQQKERITNTPKAGIQRIRVLNPKTESICSESRICELCPKKGGNIKVLTIYESPQPYLPLFIYI